MIECEERSRLMEELRAAMQRLSELRAEQLDAWRRQEPVKEASADRIRRALQIAEEARAAFEEHTRAHHCDDDRNSAASAGSSRYH